MVTVTAFLLPMASSYLLFCYPYCVHWCGCSSAGLLIQAQCWHAHSRLISAEPGFIIFPLQTWIKTLSISPANSWARIPFPLSGWQGPYLFPAGLVPCKTSHEHKKPEFHQWHQSLSHVLIRGLLLLAFFPAIEGIEETTSTLLSLQLSQ